MSRLTSWLRLWFTFERRVGRREYIVTGLALAPLKYVVDVLLVWLGTGRFWTPLDYVHPVEILMRYPSPRAATWLVPVLGLWALPFLWIGISMSMRRALDAGSSAWLALLFFVPWLNYALMAALALLPSRAPRPIAAERPREYEHRLPRALLAMAAGATLGLGTLALSVFVLRSYGVALFLGTPFVMGALTAFLFNRHYPATGRETQEVTFMTLAITGGVVLFASWEGALCLLMASPIAFGIAAMGAILGRHVALRDRSDARIALLALAVLPTLASFDARRPNTALREVHSAIVIDAAPEVVWRHVIAFPPLPAPSELVFRLGIAYPMKAEIVGHGVGATRYCVFSTGAFVEPITHWEPGRRLSFDVVTQPRPLQEWSPYADVMPPHLDGYFRSRRGEFRLIALPNGRTRLEGSTWYEMRLYPEEYWVLFGDAFIHRIHERVLAHIKRVAETSR
jgi:uncharacterized membrane protein YhaH (DUF805 family)